jgi:hypothetical protein
VVTVIAIGSNTGDRKGGWKTMYPWMAVTQIQNAMVKQMTMATTHAFFVSMIPMQIMRSMWPLPLAAPVPKGRACMPIRFS